MTEGYQNRILYVDAYDSFSNNIAALLTQVSHAEVTVISIDKELPDVGSLLHDFAAVVFGPGPGHPDTAEDIGSILRILNKATELSIPVLGICLGFQVLCSFYGLPVSRLTIPCHGHAKMILHSDNDIFCGVGAIIATCYNSLGVFPDLNDSRPSSSGSGLSTDTSSSVLSLSQETTRSLSEPKALRLLARDSDGYIMAVKHHKLPHWGFQFHPESCKSNVACQKLLKTWWAAVADWNQQRRASPPQHMSIPPSVSAFTRPISPLLEQLLKLTECSGATVQHRQIKGRSSIAQISEICCVHPTHSSTAMLESLGKGRYSIYAIPSPSFYRVEHFEGISKIFSPNAHHGISSKFPVTYDECLLQVENMISIRRAGEGDTSLPFWGGFLGYLSYELGLGLLKVNGDTQNRTPNISLLWVERSVVIDHIEERTIVQSIRKNDEKWLDETIRILNTGKVDAARGDCSALHAALSSSRTVLPIEAEYKSKIKACQEHLKAGNSYELCLTTEAQVTLMTGHTWDLYKNLRLCNPAPFAAYMQLGTISILSSSPEQFMAWDRDGAIDMIPMKGTVRKSSSMTFARAAEILASPKEQAENLMIADLVRHDLYSALGLHANVSVKKLCEVIEHETVYQLVSHIRATAPTPVDCDADNKKRHVTQHGHRALRYALPPGSMTGAPKKRSCEILSAIENRPRGVYSGVLGYLDVGGGGCFSVCIRTAFSNRAEDKNGQQTWRIGAGGAITVLSDPEAEWQEMQTKLESTLKAFRPSQPVSKLL